MSKTAEKQEMVIKWIMIEDGIIKFEGQEDTYDLADQVKKFLIQNVTDGNTDDKETIIKAEKKFSGLKATVEINSESGHVDFLAVDSSSNTTQEEPKSEETNDEVLAQFDGIVSGVSVKNKGVIFKEKENVWFTLDDNFDPQEFKDQFQGKKIRIRYTPTEKGNDIINSVELLEQPSDAENSFDSKEDSSTQKSIEAQVAVEHSIGFYAKVLSGVDVEKFLTKKDDINELIAERAKANYVLIQDLKNSK